MEKSTYYRTQVQQILSKILIEESPINLLHATEQLFDSLIEIITPVVPIDPQQKDSILQSGKALSPYWAAASIKDFKRTQCFMKGLLEAVKDLKTKHPDECLHIVYAGTGPFAVLALPVLLIYAAREVRFTFIDIHPEAIRSLVHLMGKLGLNEHIEDFVCIDATQYSLPADRKTHLVLTETMQRALVREPQVAITLHLAPQTDPDTVWIPEAIHVEAALVNSSKDMDRMMGSLKAGDTHLQNLGTVMNLTKSYAQDMALNKGSDTHVLDEVTIFIPAHFAPDYEVLTLMTTVQVYGTHRLHPYDSSITMPHNFQDLSRLDTLPSCVYLTYQMGGDPGFVGRFE